jgi:hypothetical protein
MPVGSVEMTLMIVLPAADETLTSGQTRAVLETHRGVAGSMAS